MKSFKSLLISSIFIFLIANSMRSQTRNFYGDTQTEMNINAGKGYLEWKKKMQKVLLAAIERNVAVASSTFVIRRGFVI